MLRWARNHRKSEITMQPHKQRVVDEKAALDEKATVDNFIGTSPILKHLIRKEQERPERTDRCDVAILRNTRQRIAAF